MSWKQFNLVRLLFRIYLEFIFSYFLWRVHASLLLLIWLLRCARYFERAFDCFVLHFICGTRTRFRCDLTCVVFHFICGTQTYSRCDSPDLSFIEMYIPVSSGLCFSCRLLVWLCLIRTT